MHLTIFPAQLSISSSGMGLVLGTVGHDLIIGMAELFVVNIVQCT